MIYELHPIPVISDPNALVCVVDDDEAARSDLERLFRSTLQPVETFASGEEYLKRKPHPGPVCLVLDVNMPGIGGFELQSALTGRREQLVFLTGHGDVPMCAKAMKAGAVDFLTKPVDDEILLCAVARGLDRAREVGTSLEKQAAARAILESLTPRETEVMQCVITGMLNKQIAAKLGIAEKTVKIHRGRMMCKTSSVSVPALMRLVQRAGEPDRLTRPQAVS
ncbi:MAG: response regulator [Verrucomicrobiota bacterium]